MHNHAQVFQGQIANLTEVARSQGVTFFQRFVVKMVS